MRCDGGVNVRDRKCFAKELKMLVDESECILDLGGVYTQVGRCNTEDCVGNIFFID